MEIKNGAFDIFKKNTHKVLRSSTSDKGSFVKEGI